MKDKYQSKPVDPHRMITDPAYRAREEHRGNLNLLHAIAYRAAKDNPKRDSDNIIDSLLPMVAYAGVDAVEGIQALEDGIKDARM